jgi:glycosyltransferase involved in cell wall biosynthesis
VTAVYNGASYLEERILSIVRQRYPNLEYVIVEDGSMDHTVEVIQKHEQHLMWWHSQSNRGLHGALGLVKIQATCDPK